MGVGVRVDLFFSFSLFFFFFKKVFIYVFIFLFFLGKFLRSSDPSFVCNSSQHCSVTLRGLSTLCVERTCVPWSHVAQH